MKKPCFRPGIGIYKNENEIQIELYAIRKRIDFEVDEVGAKVIRLLDGRCTTGEILEKYKK